MTQMNNIKLSLLFFSRLDELKSTLFFRTHESFFNFNIRFFYIYFYFNFNFDARYLDSFETRLKLLPSVIMIG